MPRATTSAPRGRARLGAVSAALAVLCAACATSPEASQQRGPARFALIGGPRLGGELAEDALLEVVTLLSLEPELDFCLVTGPLFEALQESDSTREALTGALGSLACRVYVAPAEDESSAELLEALEQGLSGQPDQLSHAGEAVLGLLPVVLAADGGAPEDLRLQDGELPLAVCGEDPGQRRWSLLVRTSYEPGVRVGVSGVELLVPVLANPPHAYGVGTWDGSSLTVEWRITGPGSPPESPPPIQLTPP